MTTPIHKNLGDERPQKPVTPLSGEIFAGRDNIAIFENCYYAALQYIIIAEPGKISYSYITATNKAVIALRDRINSLLDVRYRGDTRKILRVTENFRIAFHYFRMERIYGEDRDIKRIINLAHSCDEYSDNLK